MMRTAAEEAAAPKYAHVERERRWRVDPAARPGLAGRASVLIEDRYLVGTRLRLRRMTDAAGAVSLKLTKKYDCADPLARPIVTAYLTEAEYAVLAALPARALAKRRFGVMSGGATFSLDQFAGALAGLELAEIEWADDAGLRALPAPPWTLGEVSHDPRYQGGALAHFGIPKEDPWPAS